MPVEQNLSRSFEKQTLGISHQLIFLLETAALQQSLVKSNMLAPGAPQFRV